jgi:hypothetical protein
MQDIRMLNYDEMMELNTFLVSQIKQQRAILSRRARSTLVVGSTVSFTGNSGETVTGTLLKKMRKYAQVDTPSGRWRVPMNCLTAVS